MTVGEQDTSPSEVIQTVFEHLNERDADVVLRFGAEDEVSHWPVVGRLEGRTAVRDRFASMFAAFPNLRVSVERLVADGEAVFVHWHMTGKFTGAALNGIAPTGKSIDIRGTDYFTVRDGKIVSAFIAYDGMDFAAQIGALPA